MHRVPHVHRGRRAHDEGPPRLRLRAHPLGAALPPRAYVRGGERGGDFGGEGATAEGRAPLAKEEEEPTGEDGSERGRGGPRRGRSRPRGRRGGPGGGRGGPKRRAARRQRAESRVCDAAARGNGADRPIRDADRAAASDARASRVRRSAGRARQSSARSSGRFDRRHTRGQLRRRRLLHVARRRAARARDEPRGCDPLPLGKGAQRPSHHSRRAAFARCRALAEPRHHKRPLQLSEPRGRHGREWW
mmetsp:Transcript_62921/g.172811  ORF Transcript_62921/g.172811 Transcript_62921/m.172811 type:complete len:247 (-) Transcript_62921:509-1249(-)